MSYTPTSFKSFKHNVSECYAANLNCTCGREDRNIIFNTKLDGMQLTFSTQEVGELLSLMQDAMLHEISFEIYGASEF